MKKIHLDLVGIDGNAFSILGAFRKQARREGWPESDIDEVTAEATSGEYPHLLSVISEHCDDDCDEEMLAEIDDGEEIEEFE